ncbi:MAG: SGNH/GDSL hydrolase family protein [Oscillospiraceae bacterium]|nr:SGNH/GDSL hydrolase family protein [Oscillospiraceae bacterium]
MAKTILFQGDSITDAGRSRENDKVLGQGYAFLAAAELGTDAPDDYTFLNRGIGGNRTIDLYARIKADIINLKPDYLSILIGVNDVYAQVRNDNGVSAKKYEIIYDLLLSEVKAALPDIKLMILEPFLLPGTTTNNSEENPDRWDFMRPEIENRARIAEGVAKKHNAKFVPLQKMLDEAHAKNPGVWSGDGIHPTGAGHTLIKEAWLKAFREME